MSGAADLGDSTERRPAGPSAPGLDETHLEARPSANQYMLVPVLALDEVPWAGHVADGFT